MKALRIAGAVQRGEADTASHAKSEDNGGQEYHQGKRRAYGGKRIRAKKTADNQSVHNIIKLLKQVAQDNGS